MCWHKSRATFIDGERDRFYTAPRMVYKTYLGIPPPIYASKDGNEGSRAEQSGKGGDPTDVNLVFPKDPEMPPS